MAEYENHSFEHELEKQFKALDEKIKIPEIPDAQTVFELAEKKETKVFSFAKYKKAAGIAAAVVLICVSVPILSQAVGFKLASADFAAEEAVMEPAEAPRMAEDNQSVAFEGMFDVYGDAAEPEAENGVVTEYPEDGASARTENSTNSKTTEEPAAAPEDMPEEQKSAAGAKENSEIKYALNSFFVTNSMTESEPIVSDSVSHIYVDLNKKRGIDITMEQDSVSVMLLDKSAGEEVISAFWVEGVYQGSGAEGSKYVINTESAVSLDDLENGYYLPMIGDAEKGTYFIEESKIKIPEKIVKGTIALCVEIDIGTGEYQISASIL